MILNIIQLTLLLIITLFKINKLIFHYYLCVMNIDVDDTIPPSLCNSNNYSHNKMRFSLYFFCVLKFIYFACILYIVEASL